MFIIHLKYRVLFLIYLKEGTEYEKITSCDYNTYYFDIVFVCLFFNEGVNIFYLLWRWT